MSEQPTPTPLSMKEMIEKENAFKLLTAIALDQSREPTKEQTATILRYLAPLLRHRFGCWFSIWSPEDVQEYAEDLDGEDLKLDYDRAKQVCHDLDAYDYIYSEINDAVRNELITLRNSGYGEK